MKYILPYIVILFLALSCKKNDPCEGKHTHSPISTYFDSYLFKEGTYWVYQNDATAEIDSQRVTFAGLGQIGSGGGSMCGSISADNYAISVQSFLTNTFLGYQIRGGGFSRNSNASNSSDLTTILYSGDIKQPAAIPSMTINGTTFSNVRKVFVDELDGESYNFYFVDSIGIVKWEVLNGSTVLESWSIQSWDVIL